MNKKRLVSILAPIAAICLACALAACSPKKQPLVLKESDTFIVIKADGAAENATLTEYMSALKDSGELEFEIADGMIVSINGKQNAADWSVCWMLYTSDKENASDAYGTAEYKGELYDSAVLGADSLKVKNGEIYIWVYQSF